MNNVPLPLCPELEKCEAVSIFVVVGQVNHDEEII